MRLKRMHYARQIARGSFEADEPEASILGDLIHQGGWVLDIGANVGHYTLAFSKLVGESGRVIALEPMPGTFALLCSNVACIAARNVTLINAAASETTAQLRMHMPTSLSTGMHNPYQAQISHDGEFSVLAVCIDDILADCPIALAKIDAEGHEFEVLKGMEQLLRVHRPTLIIEGNDANVEVFLRELGYSYRTLPSSWNRIFEHGSRANQSTPVELSTPVSHA